MHSFVINLIKKYKADIGYKIIAQLDENEEGDLKKILYKILDFFYDINSEDDLSNNENYDSDYSEEKYEDVNPSIHLSI